MKKALALLLVAAILASLAACGGGGAVGDSAAANGKTTLMIYMIGSDLESKSGAATDDLIEIQDSGIDIENNEVVLCTGGSPEWQNDTIGNDNNTILTLSGEGYDVEEKMSQASMGEAKTLTGFLDYCVQKHPAEHYALILWNHGNGPLIGYGKDMLFDNDSLTLSEMSDALEKSSFSKNNRLDWVGFDACLMASAELCCVWAPYAQYLVASQEVEPSFGWQYSFLKELGKREPVSLIGDITQNYLSTCLDYFKEKNYDDRDTTLACVDLSRAEELSDAVNDLFAEASKNVEKSYDALASHRVDARALGRASTGSEYDLVDLSDLAKQLEQEYPDQSKKLCGLIEEMVISNATNAEGLSGMSLYYPFYNKNYYENEWSKIYRDLNVFPEYTDYLSKYEKFWLGEDMHEDYATSEIPESESESKYTLQLTDDQAKHFASAKYYILKKEGKETFTKIYSSSDVTYDNGKLTADFDGNVIYAHNELDNYIIPVTTEHDTVGDITNYSVKYQLDSSQGGSFMLSNFGEESQNVKFLNCRCLIAADKKKKEIAVSALMPYDTEQSGSDLLSGKYDEIDISDYTTYLFMEEPHRTITRTDNKVIKGVDEWLSSDSHTWDEWAVADGMEFVYAPLGYGSYSLVFEICDTQNNRYCSEPIDVDTSGVDWLKQNEKKVNTVESDGTFPVLLKEDEDFALYLDRFKDDKHDFLTFYAENKTDKKLVYNGKHLVLNDNVSCSDGYTPFDTIEAKEQTQPYTDYGLSGFGDIDKIPMEFDFGNAVDIGAVKKITSLSFDITLSRYEDKKTLWNNELFEIRFKKGAEYKIVSSDAFSEPLLDRQLEPLYGAQIKAQTLVDNEKMKIELLCFGISSKNIYGAYKVTNRLKDDTIFISSDGFAIDGIFADSSTSGMAIPPGMSEYRRAFFDNEKANQLGFTGAQKLDISFRTGPNSIILWQGYGDTIWVEGKIEKPSSAPSVMPSGDRVLLDEHDVTLKYAGYEINDYSTAQDGSDATKFWNIALENSVSEGAKFSYKDLTINGKNYADDDEQAPIYIHGSAHAGPNQKTILSIATTHYTGEKVDVKTISFTPVIYDFTGEKILFTGSKPIELKAE